ncbi:hypothetical protein EYF80_004361 [Liparis tanakae]|uniref:Uncharacterized protein n=1 Tax=Liparis tanakae TaxID=230148 RepID=A0A4Z2J561_9TELE|nr:hypothetical protein EYF80_004361 [Liparis tanakae]
MSTLEDYGFIETLISDERPEYKTLRGSSGREFVKPSGADTIVGLSEEELCNTRPCEQLIGRLAGWLQRHSFQQEGLGRGRGATPPHHRLITAASPPRLPSQIGGT